MDDDFFNIKEQTRANMRLSTKDADNLSSKDQKKNARLSLSPASSKQNNRNCKHFNTLITIIARRDSILSQQDMQVFEKLV